MRIYYYAITIVGVLLLLNLAGLDLPASGLVKTLALDTPELFRDSEIITKIFTILAVASVTYAVVGSFARTPPESYVIGAMVSLFAGAVITDFVSLLIFFNDAGNPVVASLASLLLAPLLIGFMVSAVSYWRGTD